MKARLILEDGTIFEGNHFGAIGENLGEVVFNTGMTGYQEVLTDPSYYGQIVTMTYPLIGNYGINSEDFESAKPHVRGFIVRELCSDYSNWRAKDGLNDYLKKHNIIGLEGIDTRALTRILREKGTMKGLITTEQTLGEYSRIIGEFELKRPVEKVAVKEPVHYKGNGFKVALLDFGAKQNIVRSLNRKGCDVTVFPSWTAFDEIMAFNPDGIMLSNGPGDPKDETKAIENIKQLINSGKPIFGICLGHQLMALASGADTQKLKYGHRGCNHPVKDLNKDKTFITSQNHGYAVIENSVNKNMIFISHINMNDGTVEGLRYKELPVFSVQFHPEASPGPQDTEYLFDEFIELMKNKRGNSNA